MEYLLGLDIGTTNIKAIVVDCEGQVIKFATQPTPVAHPRPKWSEFDPEQIWQATCACIRQITGALEDGRIASVGISSMGEAGVPLDAAGNPLYNFIAWYDFRSEEQAAQLVARLGESEIYGITGQIPSPKQGLTKLMWLQENQPEIRDGMRHWLSMEDYILFRLSGAFATDYTVASRTMALDVRARAWSEQILDAAGVAPSRLPEALPGGTPIGHVSAQAAQQTGLSRDVLVVTGGHDHACAAVAVGIGREGVTLDSMGTAEVLMTALNAPALTPEARRRCYSFYPHFGKRLYRVLTSNQSCGASVEWYLRSLGRDIEAACQRSGENKYAALIERARSYCESMEDPYFLPLLRGTEEQANARGVFWGVQDTHGQEHMIRAVLEGMCFELNRQIDGYRQMFGLALDQLHVVGGLSRSAALMQMKANMQGGRVYVPQNTEAAATGAALLGGLGAGVLTEAAMERAYRRMDVYQADPLRVAFNERRYQTYVALRESVMRVYLDLK